MTRGLFLVLGIAFFGFVAWALGVAPLFEEGGQIWGLVWGKVTLVDLYLGFLIFAVFVFHIESNKILAMLIASLLFILGNGVALLYVGVRYQKIIKRLSRSE